MALLKALLGHHILKICYFCHTLGNTVSIMSIYFIEYVIFNKLHRILPLEHSEDFTVNISHKIKQLILPRHSKYPGHLSFKSWQVGVGGGSRGGD